MSKGDELKTALITGVTGQDGSYLAEFLISKGYRVIGLMRGQDNPKRSLLQELIPKLEIVSGDLTDVASLIRAIDDAEPDEIYNLAAISFVAYSWEQALLTTEVTAKGVINILEAIRTVAPRLNKEIRFYQASSSEMFGKVQTVPQNENTNFWPRSPYGVAKTFGHHITVNYRESYGLHASSGILFNHESPRRGPEFVTRKISLGVSRIALGHASHISLGNLDAKRDWGFAGDYVEAMWRMLQLDTPEDFVISTGKTWSVRDFLEKAFDAAGIKDWQEYVLEDRKFMRPAEVDTLLGDASKAKRILNWEPKVNFEELVKMMVESDLRRINLYGPRIEDFRAW
jgi:GDPmannose 4,6-dehydratase